LNDGASANTINKSKLSHSALVAQHSQLVKRSHHCYITFQSLHKMFDMKLCTHLN